MSIPQVCPHLAQEAWIWCRSQFPFLLAGFRGGFIFPTFFAGTAFGHAIFRGITAIPHIAPFIGNAPPILFCMTVAVGAFPVQADTPRSALRYVPARKSW